MQTDESTSFIVVTTESTDGMRGEPVRKVVEKAMSVETLKSSLDRFLGSLRDLVEHQTPRQGAFVLDEITFSAEIGAEGEFKLLGSGVTVSSTSSIDFVMRRRA
ncbi:hypothetical protein OM076_33970 [Solirubrobacter ginsenosidimutans]|uniref:Pepco domain-containing protein n=1 Tax=Solirubrobacter ginsenosidimutans TaxID=490573 RepID=A0A9X3N0Z9_9ACTN|nr:hypothetical protein [Solirubrobacter ginsenosidimutans]MDA0165326.1 hypothetical protein [Solirubrobacter ginsenosidimutans]